MVVIVIVGYYFISTYVLKRGGGAIEKVGFGPLEDADNDGVQNFVDACCAPACNPANFGNKPVELSGDLRGCVKDAQGRTPCDAAACNPAPVPTPAPRPAVAGTPAQQPSG